MSTVDWELLSRSAAGDTSAAEQALVDAWLAESAEHRELFRAVREVALDGRSTTGPERRAEVLASIKRSAPRDTRPLALLPASTARRLTGRRAAAAAAMAAAVALVAGAIGVNVSRPDVVSSSLRETVVRTLSTP